MTLQERIIQHFQALGHKEIGKTVKYIKYQDKQGRIYYIGKRGAVKLKMEGGGFLSLTDKYEKMFKK